MKLVVAVISVLVIGVSAWGNKARFLAQNPASQTPPGREPVVVELFTSEGCSSCPPADSLLSALDARQPWATVDVIAIEEHVDYWDQQGWKDPFSSATWTDRQREYSDTLHSGGPYTPEMVIDGKTEFVGSKAGVAQQEIERAATEKKTKVEISEVSPVQNKSVVFKVSVQRPLSVSPKDTLEVILAITESGLHSSVKAGENSGHELQHSPVLRELKVIGVAGKNGQDTFTSEPSVKFDSKWNVENLRAIVFVQEKKSRHILGAAAIRLTH